MLNAKVNAREQHMSLHNNSCREEKIQTFLQNIIKSSNKEWIFAAESF